MALRDLNKFSKEQITELDRLNQEAVVETNQRLERIENMDIRIDKRITDVDKAFDEAMEEQKQRDEEAKQERIDNNKFLKLNNKVLTGITSKVDDFSKNIKDNLQDGFTEFLKSPAGIALGIVLVTFIAKNIVDPLMSFFDKTGDFLNQNYESLEFDPGGEFTRFSAANVGGETASVPARFRGLFGAFSQRRADDFVDRLGGTEPINNRALESFYRARGEQIIQTSQKAFDFKGRIGIDDELYEAKTEAFQQGLREMGEKVTRVNIEREKLGLPKLSTIEAFALQRGEIKPDELLDREIIKRIAEMSNKQDYLAEVLIEGFNNLGDSQFRTQVFNVNNTAVSNTTPE